MRYDVRDGRKNQRVSVGPRNPAGSTQRAATVGEYRGLVEVLSAGPPCVVSVNHRVFEVQLVANRKVTGGAAGAWDAQIWDGELGPVRTLVQSEAVGQPARTGDEQESTSQQLRSPIPGRVLRVLVSEGDSVAKGEAVLVVEAMKMENELFAPGSGRITELRVKAGDTVEAQAPLLNIEPDVKASTQS